MPSLVTKPLVMIDVTYAQDFNKVRGARICPGKFVLFCFVCLFVCLFVFFWGGA